MVANSAISKVKKGCLAGAHSFLRNEISRLVLGASIVGSLDCLTLFFLAVLFSLFSKHL